MTKPRLLVQASDPGSVQASDPGSVQASDPGLRSRIQGSEVQIQDSGSEVQIQDSRVPDSRGHGFQLWRVISLMFAPGSCSSRSRGRIALILSNLCVPCSVDANDCQISS